MRKMIASLTIATLLLVALGGVAAAKDGKDARAEGRMEMREHGNRLLFHNDQIAVLFHGNGKHASPDFRVVFNGSVDDEKAGYRVKLLRLYEADRNDTKFDGKLPAMNLARSDDWNVVSEEGNGTLTLTMTRAEAQGIVTLVWHLDTTRASVKFDVKVDNWRWGNASHVLILDSLVQGRNLRNETGARISVEDAGYVSWADHANATYADGSTGALNVSAFQKKVGGDDDEKARGDDERGEREMAASGKGGHVFLVFDGPGGYKSLDYDPEVGVQSSSVTTSAVPGFGFAVMAVAVVGAALLVSRRR